MRKPLLWGLVAALIFVVLTTSLALRHATAFIETERLISHTHDVSAQISGAHAEIRDVESAVRGFGLTGDERFLESVPAHREEIRQGVDRLRNLTRDNPAQQARMEQLGSLLAERSDLWDTLIRRRRAEGVSGAAQQAMLGREVSGRIRTVLDAMEGEEDGLLRRRIVESERSATETRVLLGSLAATSALFFIALFFVASHYLEVRKRAERDLDQFFSTSLDLMGIASLNAGKFIRVSPSWERTLGWTPGEGTSRPWIDFVHPDDVAATHAAAAGLSRGEPVITFQNRYRCRDGGYRWLSWKVPAPFPGSAVLYCVARDVTAFKQTEEEIRRLNGALALRVEETLAANKELDAFSYSVSHDLRSPLRAIDGFSRLLIEDFGASLGPEGNRFITVIRENTQRMGQLIDDLLQFSRLGRKELEKTHVEMAELARDAVEELRRGETARSVEVVVEDLPPVRGDRALLKQVWANLVSNAWKYSKRSDKARIEIGAERKGAEIVFHVRDNGVGFDMQYVDKLFGVFQRLHSKSEFEGTGVGLAIVQRVIHRHRGRVWAEAKPGEGAVFYFSIPT